MKIKTWQYIVIGLLALAAVGLVALHAWLTPYDLKAERAAAAAAGLPLTAEDMKRKPPPAAEDAGPDWLALVKELEKRPMEFQGYDTAAERPRAMRQNAEVLRENADLVARIHRAAAKPSAYFEHEFSVYDLFPHYAKMRAATMILGWESRRLAHEGDYAGAIRTQERTFRIGDQLAEEPLLIGLLVRFAIQAMSTAGLEDILHEAGPNARVAAQAREALLRHPPPADMGDALRGETVFGLNTIRSLQNPAQLAALAGRSLTPPPTAPRDAGPVVRRFVIDPSEAAYLHWMARIHEAARLPIGERSAALERIELEMGDKSWKAGPSMILTNLMLPVYSTSNDRLIYELARHAVALAACDVLEHRALTGDWPTRLQDATSSPPTDPCTGKPVGYRREGDGFVVYSVGETGTFTAQAGQPTKGESLFRYPRPFKAVGSDTIGGPPVTGGPPMPAPAP